MKIQALLIVVATFAVSALADSSDRDPALAKFAKLGVVEVSDGETQRVTSADGCVFIIRSFIPKNRKSTLNNKRQEIVLIINKEERDPSGLTRYTPDMTMTGPAWHDEGMSDGVTGFIITPKIKP